MFFGQFGRREIDWPLMMMCCQSRDSNIFLFSHWSEAKLFIADRPLTIVSFIDWLGSR